MDSSDGCYGLMTPQQQQQITVTPLTGIRLTHPAEAMRMVSGKQAGVRPRFGPSKRILELAQHKTSKTIWATTPCEKLRWGNQEPIRPISFSALRATPSSRIQYLAQHKRDFSAREDPRRPLHTPQCENNCPIWHVDPRMRNVVITARLLQLSQPKQTHKDYSSNRESAASVVSFASRAAQISQRVAQLSLPKLKQSNICYQLGHLEDTIWTVTSSKKGFSKCSC
ncbi:PREDICTED: testicular haploid expressed gene protein-like isoform X3 [Cyprinodon variegatus]|uniref:testicular haploid expressed gene protein-like isoform X3 n=1 Tax=Cyprinodon variegatus TaxID=28743 RepID=UPI000742C170|nr:PREDICTED: testicular haploid expressed gene protein-like isoform X3 [Cyprinodon variegatus]